MAETLSVTVPGVQRAEDAGGALMDHGVEAADLSLLSRGAETTARRDFAAHSATPEERRSGCGTSAACTAEGNDLVDAGDSAVAGAESGGNRAADGGDRLAAWMADAAGAEGAARHGEQAAERRDQCADTHVRHASAEFRGPRTRGPRPRGVHEAGPGAAYDFGTEEDETGLNATAGIRTPTTGDAASGAVKGAGVWLGVGAAAALASLLVPGVVDLFIKSLARFGVLASLLVPGVGLVMGGGALASAIAGAAGAVAAGAVAGGVTGQLKAGSAFAAPIASSAGGRRSHRALEGPGRARGRGCHLLRDLRGRRSRAGPHCAVGGRGPRNRGVDSAQVRRLQHGLLRRNHRRSGLTAA